MKRDRYSISEDIKANRRSLRSNPTKAEQVFWYEIRDGSKLGYKFRRQVSIDSFIVDFYCHTLQLIIELDGPVHEEQKEYDKSREEILKKKGYMIVRFENDQVLFEREKVIEELRRLISQIKNKKLL